MDKIPSFTIDHLKLLRGVYVSRKDPVGDQTLTTFDIRMKEPNREPVLDVPAIHAMEHLGATFLRNDNQWKDKVIYFGPMGCRTGHYLILRGDLSPMDIKDLMINLFNFMTNYTGEIPGATPKDCGNYLSMDLNMAKYESKRFLENTLGNLSELNTVYP